MTIIEQRPIMVLPVWYVEVIVWVMIGIFLSGIIATIIYAAIKGVRKLNPMLMLAVFCVPLIVLSFMGGFGLMVDSGRSRYKVELSDEYPANELYENYTNIRYLGDNVYVFEDKV